MTDYTKQSLSKLDPDEQRRAIRAVVEGVLSEQEFAERLEYAIARRVAPIETRLTEIGTTLQKQIAELAGVVNALNKQVAAGGAPGVAGGGAGAGGGAAGGAGGGGGGGGLGGHPIAGGAGVPALGNIGGIFAGIKNIEPQPQNPEPPSPGGLAFNQGGAPNAIGVLLPPARPVIPINRPAAPAAPVPGIGHINP